MSRLLDDEQDELPQRERELTLSTGAILAIFLGLVLLCGVFFGFGYNLGRKATTASNAALPAATSDAEPSDTGSSTFDNFKPSPTSPPAAANTPASATSSTGSASQPAATENASTKTVETQPAPPPAPLHTAPAPSPTRAAAAPTPTSSSPTKPAQPAAPAIAPNGSFIVQIAAISGAHKDDADLLTSALRGRGYTVTERTDATDKLIHVQVGPFATKADAEAMRERLVVDGYNPIIK